MLRGEVFAALRLLDEQSSGGVFPPLGRRTIDVLQDLRLKHPVGKESNPTFMLDGG